MQPPTTAHVRELLSEHEPPCLSLYQPTHRTYPENQQDPIRFRNLLKAIEGSLRQKYPKREVWSLLDRFEVLAEDGDFWNHTLDGLAIFTTAQALPEAAPSPSPGGSAQRTAKTVYRTRASSLWAVRLARIYEVFPLVVRTVGLRCGSSPSSPIRPRSPACSSPSGNRPSHRRSPPRGAHPSRRSPSTRARSMTRPRASRTSASNSTRPTGGKPPKRRLSARDTPAFAQLPRTLTAARPTATLPLRQRR
jgi:hypothetical protein